MDLRKFFRPPLLTCEPVLTEAAFLLKREGREADPLFALLERGVIRVALDVQDEQAALRALATGPCHSRMPVWCDCRNSKRTERFSRWTPISASTVAMGTK